MRPAVAQTRVMGQPLPRVQSMNMREEALSVCYGARKKSKVASVYSRMYSIV